MRAWARRITLTTSISVPAILVANGPTKLFNPTIKQSVIDRADEDDPAVAASEWGGQFRNDLESYVNPEIVDACTVRGVYRLDPVKGVSYIAHADPSGGGQDSFTCAIGHVEGDIGVLDVLLEKRPPFISIDSVVEEFCSVLKEYNIFECVGDRKHYDEPVPFHKAMPGAKSIVIMKRYDDGIPDGFTPPTRKKIPNVRNAYNEPIDDEIGKPAEKGNDMTYDYDTSRGPYHAILDKMARAHQAITGDSYAKSFTAVYTDPKNAAIRDGSKYDDLAKAFDSTYGTAHSLVKAAPQAPSYDPIAKQAEIAEQFGPAHAKLHSMAVDHQRAHSGMSYQQAYSHLYSRMENAPLREKIKTEHLRASMAAVQDQGELGKAAPADAIQDDVTPGSADLELHGLVVARMKREPGLSYERAFTREYLHPDNRSLKDRVTAEGILRMQAMSPAKPFPAYTSPGHSRDPSNVGRSGAKPRGMLEVNARGEF
jgi:hypothetical protein